MNDEILSYLSTVFLFKNVEINLIESLTSGICIDLRSFKKDEKIYEPKGFEKKVGFIYEGECTVNKKRADDNYVCINRLKKFNSFGILAVFSDEEFPTYVIASKNCKILFISADDIIKLTQTNGTIAYNIIKFMANRISFLNERISTYSGGSCEEKLASYLIYLSKQTQSLEFEFNKKRGAEAIGCGRASLYRAIAYLTESGAIILDDKKIIIKNISILERISK